VDAEVGARLDPTFGEPNHGAAADGDLVFIGNSGWDRVNARDELETDANSSPPFLFRLRPRLR
jgi:hypothetical protein